LKSEKNEKYVFSNTADNRIQCVTNCLISDYPSWELPLSWPIDHEASRVHARLSLSLWPVDL